MLRRLTGILVVAAGLSGAAEDPVQWTFAFDAKSAAPGSHALGRLVAKVDAGWHVYSLTTPKGGPIPTTVSLAENPAVASFKVYQPKPERKFDPNFQLDTETFADQAVLLLDVEFKKDAPPGPAELTAQVRYQCCNDRECLPPKRKSATAAVTIDPAAKPGIISIPPGYAEVNIPATGASVATGTANPPAPVTTTPASQGLSLFLLTAFLGGVAAIFTPCVFPMIPFTVSYFMNRQLRQAARWSGAGRRLLRSESSYCSPARPAHQGHRGTDRSGQARKQPVGERLHRTGVHRVRVEPAGRV